MNRKERRNLQFGNFNKDRWQYNNGAREMLSMDKDIVDAMWESFFDNRPVEEILLLWDNVPSICDAYILDEKFNRIDGNFFQNE